MNIEAEKSGDSICQENDGCPTELAVLQRYWRKQQALTQGGSVTLRRYGVSPSRQSGDPLLSEMPDGYWTPWHIAQAALQKQLR